MKLTSYVVDSLWNARLEREKLMVKPHLSILVHLGPDLMGLGCGQGDRAPQFTHAGMKTLDGGSD